MGEKANNDSLSAYKINAFFIQVRSFFIFVFHVYFFNDPLTAQVRDCFSDLSFPFFFSTLCFLKMIDVLKINF